MTSRNSSLPSIEYYVVQGVVLGAIFFFATFGNFLACFVVYKTDSVNSRATSFFIISLAVADLMRGILAMPFALIASFQLGRMKPGVVICNLFGFTNTLFLSAGLLTLGAVSIDRFVAITRPLKYYQTMTSSKAIAMIIFVWIISLIDATVPLLDKKDGYSFSAVRSMCIVDWKTDPIYNFATFCTSFVVPFCILTFCYIRIFQVAWRQQKKIQALEQTLETNGVARGTSRRRRNIVSFRVEKRSSFTIFIVFGVFCLCISPYYIINIWSNYNRTDYESYLLAISSLVSYANSACNPFLYGILNKMFRQTFLNLLICKVKHTNVRGVHSKNGQSLASRRIHILRELDSSVSTKSDDLSERRFYTPPRRELQRSSYADRFTSKNVKADSPLSQLRKIKMAVMWPLNISMINPAGEVTIHEEWNRERRFSRLNKSASETNLAVLRD